jgi:predicted nucleic acid-binding protein
VQAVFDTNVLVSALLWRGPPHALLEAVRNGSIALITSPALLAELRRAPTRRASRRWRKCASLPK